MKRDRLTVRDVDAGDSLEIVLITAITTILNLRVYLILTGYPQVGGKTLHIAHMLWGGLAMMVALVILLTYWNPAVRRTAAVVTGFGWGLFIDELGKFITKDNDDLYRPTFALLYILFVVMFIVFRALTQGRALSAHEIEVNRELRVQLRTADDAHGVGGRIAHLILDVRGRIDRGYEWFAIQPWFKPALIGLFLAVALTDLGRALWHVYAGSARVHDLSRYEIVTALAANGCVWLGIIRLRRSLVTALRWFQRSLIVIMLLSTPLHFYDQQLDAVKGLLGVLVLYMLLRYAIVRETEAA